jgi:hypothetical protein
MQIFGWKFERAEEPEAMPKQAAHQDLGVQYRPLLSTCNPSHLDYFKRLVFPDPSKLNMFEKVGYEKHLVELAESLLKRGRFSICFLNEMEKLFELKFTETTFQFYKQLQHLHMVKYENIPPEILEAIPMMMSAIMTEGRSLKDVAPADAPPPLMLTRVEHSCYEKHGHY